MPARYPDDNYRDCPQTPLPEKLQAFWFWMVRHRGLMPSTLEAYCSDLSKLVSALGGEPTRYTALGVRKFILDRAAHHSAGHARHVASAVRAFLRFLVATGQCAPGLVAAVPRIATWRFASLPRFVSADKVEKIVAACDRRTRMGKRDYAILLLLARLGLRAGDISALRVSDIDWQRGELLLFGKGRRQARLPLPQDAGNAILAYIMRARAATEDDHVFIHVRRPWRALSNCAIINIVYRAIRHSGVTVPFRGAHLFRHSLATLMLRNGAPLQTIARVLRHRSIETTSIYAKVDLKLLREVAQPWPEAMPC